MKNIQRLIPILMLFGSIFAHGISEADKTDIMYGGLLDFVFLGAKHMVTGFDHILFLIGVIFFLSRFLDIIKFVTAFTIGHSLTLIFATLFNITANYYLIDAVIAFSVIYKGFENLNGFKKYMKINTPNLILMVFIFGLVHGFGLSTKLQEVALESNIDLSLLQILSFNLGVEFGQVMVLFIIFPLLSMFRGKFFNQISKSINWFLVIAGIFLLIYQLNGYYNNHDHEDIKMNDHKSHHHHH
jgi:hypothetical protein